MAASHGPNPAVKARQAHMDLYAFNIGYLGSVAKGETEYDAEAAVAAASNLAALTKLSHRGYWAPNTSNADLGDQTRALPALWEEGSQAGEFGAKLAEAAANLAAVAGDGKDAMAAALGPVGQTCGGCHEKYRQPN
jgi:cytochrome c556